MCGMTLKIGIVSYYNVKYGWIEFRPGNDGFNELVVTPRRVIGHLLYVGLGLASLFAARDCMRKRLIVGVLYVVALLLGLGIANVIAIPEIMFGAARSPQQSARDGK